MFVHYSYLFLRGITSFFRLKDTCIYGGEGVFLPKSAFPPVVGLVLSVGRVDSRIAADAEIFYTRFLHRVAAQPWHD
jgi:hypothetical protein